ncbi:hypothetical protein [Roseateles sp. P5_E1]
MTATLNSTAVTLGTNGNHVFTYSPGGDRPEGILHIMLLTQGQDGVTFDEYQKHTISVGHTRFEVPPPPALRSVEPYLLIGVVADLHRPNVPQTLGEFCDWIDASKPPFHWSGQFATHKQFSDARRAAQLWESEFWLDPEKRSTVEIGIAAQRFEQLMFEVFPANRLSWQASEELVGIALERHIRVKRDTQGLKPCVACMLALGAVTTSAGIAIAFGVTKIRMPFLVQDLGEQPPIVKALLEWVLSRIREQYGDATPRELIATLTAAGLFTKGWVSSSMEGYARWLEETCRRYTDCGDPPNGH